MLGVDIEAFVHVLACGAIEVFVGLVWYFLAVSTPEEASKLRRLSAEEYAEIKGASGVQIEMKSETSSTTANAEKPKSERSAATTTPPTRGPSLR